MKNYVKIFMLFAIVSIMAACSKDEFYNEISEPIDHELSVAIESGVYQAEETGTKATTEAVVRASWTKGDKVSVINVTKGKILGGQLSADKNGVNVNFSGTVSGDLSSGDKLVYLYPAIDDNDEEVDFETYNIDLSSQTYDASNSNVVFYGYAEDTYSSEQISKVIYFTLATSYVHLNMSDLTPSTSITGISISNINGGLAWAIEGGAFKVNSYKVNEGISVSCSNVKSSASGNTVVRLAVPASDAVDQRTLSVNNTLATDYITSARVASNYYNQIFSNFSSKVSVTTSGSNTAVVIDDASTNNVSASLPTEDSFTKGNTTEITVGGIGTVTFDDTATDKILSNAGTASSVFFKVEDVTEKTTTEENEVVYEVTMKTVDETGTEVFSESVAAGTATVEIPLPNASNVSGVYLLVGSTKTAIDNYTFNNGVVTFKVTHFSEYAIDYTPYGSLVAKIGNREYPTLEGAIAAVPTDGTQTTITLLKNIALSEKTNPYTIAAGMNVVLDLNGKTISYESNNTGSDALITNKGDLKIKDSSTGGKITAKQNTGWVHGCYTIDNAGTNDVTGHFVLESGTIENTSAAGLAWCVNNGWYATKADVVINGGTLHNVYYVPIRNYLQAGGSKTITINDGTFTSDNSRAVALQFCSATVAEENSYIKIKGGTFNCKGSGIFYMDLHQANVNTTGFTYEVSGGTFTNSKAEAPVVVYDYEGKDQTSAVLFSNIICGGTYSANPTTWVAEDYQVTESSGTYTVTPKAKVAKIGDNTYTSLAKAFAAVQEGETITLQSDYETGSDYTIYNTLALTQPNVTLDLNGYTLTTTGNLSLCIAGNNIIVKNGKIYAGATAERACGYNSYAIFVAAKAEGTGVTGVKFQNVETKGGIMFGGATSDPEYEYRGYGVGTLENCTVTSGEYYCVYAQNSGSVATVLSGTYNYIGHSGCIISKGNDGEYSVQGGTYNQDPSAYLTAGYTAQKSGETWTVVESKYVAQIGDTKYTDLATALGATGSGQTCKLLHNVDLKDVEWTPVSDFKGTFDGNNFTISNLTLSGTDNLGLFGSASGATFKNLTIDNAQITSTGKNVGVLVGNFGVSYAYNVTISNATISASGDEKQYVGGLVGNSSGTIESCSVTNSKITGVDQVGGIAGYQWCNGVWNCTATNNTVTASSERAGGLIGKFQASSGNDSFFKMSGNTINGGFVTAPDMAGGLAGQIMGNMTNYEIKNNNINVTLSAPKESPIGVLRTSDCSLSFYASLAANITGNTWTTATLDADRYTYTDDGCSVTFADQIIWNGTAKTWTDYAASSYTAKDETNKTITIGSAAELALFANEQNTSSGTKYSGYTITLNDDIDLGNYVWEPIIVAQNKDIIFDGGNHTISNLYVAVPSTSSIHDLHAGLFSCFPTSTAKNLTINGANVTGYNHVAAIAGYGICAKFENCHVQNAIVTSLCSYNESKAKYDNGDKAGAICGYLSGEGTAWVKSCSAKNCIITAYRDLGSLVGIANYTSEVSGNTATDCNVICNQRFNPEGYTSDAQYNAKEIVGRISDNATIKDNTYTNVTISYTR